ncbi:GNAT family N-acetyltransferase [Pseudarthrobacter sp. P1]|uniref:GNAT family N-acetyltransferase n=1 Tax=Pseudarthrobacter sp. P1 TaxID=3418418 RepID=UPI003CE6752C
MAAVLAEIFADPAVDRVVVEPDSANAKIHGLNERLGFRRQARIQLPDKEAWLSLCTRRHFNDARRLLARPVPAPATPAPTVSGGTHR